ncbi:uncharacterized protein ddias isoform X2 [Syngnathoides biaculeatus]|nr:uncharacterized protein ddias isoform X2 [Syngnathoides biaculeatus]XP_061670504.1 uncharacterized protein ddias isoform X2 [Syngnathoides biaculeatus]XP_061670505.1 uncharacterized protein ddias isoform X2 [Syngnathoides biaculeatus]
MDVEHQDTARSRCSKCSYSCLRDHLDYRYRLSLLVTRDTSIFGVTVFGSCLNPLFGVPATQFQRLLENSDVPPEGSTRSKLVAKAIEDCLVGRHLVFGIKVRDSQWCPWSGDRHQGASGSKEMAQFIATQLIFPKAAGLGNDSVLGYFRLLLRKAEERRQESNDPEKSCAIPTTPPSRIPQDSQASSFNNITLSRVFPHSLERSQRHDDSLTPTPPWQQSLRLITSSAEQEREETDYRTRDDDRPTAKEQKWNTFFDTPPFSPCSPARNVPNAPTRDHLTPSLPLLVNKPLVSDCQPDDSLVLRSLVWEELPFSESLTAFLNDEDKYFETTQNSLPNKAACTDNPPGSKSFAGVVNTEVLNEDSEQVYNCSLDLFGISSVEPHKEDVELQMCVKKAHKIPSGNIKSYYPQCPDFIPSSQSTPIVRRTYPSPSCSQRLSFTTPKNFLKRPCRKRCFAIQGGIVTGKTPREHDTPLSQGVDDYVVPHTSPEFKVENDHSQEETQSYLSKAKRCEVARCETETELDQTSNEMTANGSTCKDKTCDWSRDLFSDSV